MQKICKTCLQTKEITEFYHKATGKDGFENFCKNCRLQKLYWKNPDKKKSYNRAYWIENKEILEPKKKQYFDNNKEKEVARGKEYYKKHREEILKQKVIYGKEYNKRSTTKALKNATCAKRRAAKLQRTPKWLTDFHLIQIKIFYTTATVMKKETGINYAVDHIIPLQGKLVSGLHVPWNLQILTKSQNSIKGTKLV